MLLALEVLEKLTAYRNRNGKSDNIAQSYIKYAINMLIKFLNAT